MKASVTQAARTISRGKWIILAVFLFVMALVSAYLVTSTPVYEASTVLLVDTPSSSRNDAFTHGVLDGLPSGNRTLANQVLILQRSVVIAERVAERLLAHRTSSGASLSILKVSDGAPPLTAAQLARRLQGHVFAMAENERMMDALRISVRSHEPEEAALIANLYAEEYINRSLEVSRLRIASSREYLEEQERRSRDELQALENQMQQFMGREGAIALHQEAQHTVSQIAQLETVLDEARIERSSRQARLRSLEAELEQIQPVLVQQMASGTSRALENAQAQIAELELQVEQIYSGNPSLRSNPSSSPNLIRFQSEIADQKDRVRILSEQYVAEMLASGGVDMRGDGTGMAYVSNLRREIAEERIAGSALQAQIEALQARLLHYDGKLRTLPAQSIYLAQLQRAQQSSERSFMDLEAKLHSVRMAEEAEISLAEIISPALIPSVPIAPRAGRALTLGAVIALILGFVAANVRSRLDTRIYTPDDLRSFRVPVLGAIADMRKELRASPVIKVGDAKVSSSLTVLLNPFSAIAEEYRRLYMNLQFMKADRVVQTILVTSSEAGAGKSTTVVNLAATTAQAGRRTLIIDCDLRNPTIHKLLGEPHRPSLLQVLTADGKIEFRQLATKIENVYMIASGHASQNAPGILSSDEMKDLLIAMREHFDIIIFDSPPVMALTDAVMLAAKADATVLVVDAGRTDASALQQSLEELQAAGASIAGAVLNRFRPTREYGYRHTYRYRYTGYKHYGHIAMTN